MMDFNDMFKELDRFTEKEKIYICCEDKENYMFEDNILVCKKCNKTISNILDSPEWRYYGSEDTKNSDPTRCGMPVNVLLPESSVGTVVSNQFCKDKGMYRVKQYQSWTSMTYKERSIYKVFTEITDNYGCMVINNRVHSTNITDKVFWYKAKSTPSFTMGSKKYKKYHKKHYDKNWNKRIQVFDPSSILSKRKNNSRIIIEKVK